MGGRYGMMRLGPWRDILGAAFEPELRVIDKIGFQVLGP